MKRPEDCDVTSHSKKAATLFGDIEDVIFIRAQPEKEGLSSVHSAPTLPRSAFGDAAWTSHWSVAEKTVNAWQISFAALVSQGAGTTLEDLASIEVCARTSKQVSFAITPSKKRGAGAAGLGESPGDFEVQLLPMIDPLGPTVDTALAALMGPAWGAVTQNVQAVERIARAAHARVKARVEDVDRDLEQVDLKLSGLHALLGERSPDFGTQDVFSVLEGILEDIDGFKSNEAALMKNLDKVRADITAPLAEALTRQVSTQIVSYLGGSPAKFSSNFVTPLLTLLRRCSPDVKNPGAIWSERLALLHTNVQTLEKKMGRVEHEVEQVVVKGRLLPSVAAPMKTDDVNEVWGADGMDVDSGDAGTQDREVRRDSSTWVPTTDWVALGDRIKTLSSVLYGVQRAVGSLQQSQQAGILPLGTHPRPDGDAPIGSSGSLAMTQRLETLEKEVAELRGQLRMSGVTVGGFTFDSPADVRAWLGLHGLQGKTYLFVDPLSLLSMSDTMAADEKDATQERLNTERIKDGCTEATRYRASFMIEIPPILGKRGDPTTSPNERQLAAIPKYEDWDTGMGRDGVADRLTDLLSEGDLALSYQINDQLNGPALQLALKMLTLSMSFWEKLGSWMTRYFGEIRARSQSRPQDCWILVTHCVRRILSEAQKARSPGRTGQAHDMLWGALQAHSLFSSILEHKIQGHPKISVILQQHLVDHATPMSSFLTLEATVKELQRQVGQHSKAQDRGVTFANKQAAAKPKGAG